jgi:hypothetical protein
VNGGNEMRNIAFTLVLIFITVAGCTIRNCYWYNPAKTLEEARGDCQECYNKAVAEASEAVAKYYYDRAALHNSLYGFGRGSVIGESDDNALYGWFMWEDSYRQNVFRGCMKSRGYRRIKADQLGQSIRKRSLSMDNVAGK